MKKKLLAIIAALALLSAAGCSGKSGESSGSSTPSSTPEKTVSGTVSSDSSSEETSSEKQTETDAPVVLTAAKSDGKLSVTRMPEKNTKMGEENTWTIFVYLCGTDLETGSSAATSDLLQMLESKSSEKVKFILQTGGTNTWNNAAFKTDKSERYVVQNQDFTLADTQELTSMGLSDTLSSFLKWGVANYPADKMGLIFWEHGSGSINGVCFDEKFEKDSLTLKEIENALSQVSAEMTDNFEFIGLDACLMGTLETANTLASFARYMYASQETEPGSGWDYTAIGNYLADNPDADGGALGKVIADSFYEECKTVNQEDSCTLTIVDLKKLDNFLVAFNDFSYKLYNSAPDNLSGIVRGITGAENFGGNNKTEGYTNMVDVGSIMLNCSQYSDGTAALSALENCIYYNKNGTAHKNASGLSVYYPLFVEGSDELRIFSEVCTSPYYFSIVDMVARGYSDEAYSNETLFDSNGKWSSEVALADDYFSYADETSEDTESKLITFEEKPHLDANGNYGFKLDENSLDYAASVEAYIYADLDGVLLELGETYDINADWDTGVFYDNFDGYWFALPDETLLATYIVNNDEDYAVYTSPVMLNGKQTNLRIIVDDEGAYIDGAWDGIDEDGIPSREIIPIKEGDKIEPLMTYSTEEGTDTYTASAYTWQKDDNVIYAFLPEGSYGYCFYINDVYGDYLTTEDTTFTIDKEGNILFPVDSE